MGTDTQRRRGAEGVRGVGGSTGEPDLLRSQVTLTAELPEVIRVELRDGRRLGEGNELLLVQRPPGP